MASLLHELCADPGCCHRHDLKRRGYLVYTEFVSMLTALLERYAARAPAVDASAAAAIKPTKSPQGDGTVTAAAGRDENDTLEAALVEAEEGFALELEFEAVKALFGLADMDRNGFIDVNEFVGLLSCGALEAVVANATEVRECSHVLLLLVSRAWLRRRFRTCRSSVVLLRLLLPPFMYRRRANLSTLLLVLLVPPSLPSTDVT